jgi:hypothetical protein
MANVSVPPAPTAMPAKVLLGWLPKEAALQFLNDCVFNEPLTPERAERIWSDYMTEWPHCQDEIAPLRRLCL